MKLIDGLKLQGHPVEIPDCSRDDLPAFFVELGFKVGAEIGVDKGEFSQKLAQTGLKLYAIDPWLANKEYRISRRQSKLDAAYQQAKKILAPYPNCLIIKKTSMEAVEDFADESLDFVYIDGNHEFRYIAEDLVEWTKKVRTGGIISGHDYFYTQSSKYWHVAYVLNAFVSAYNIHNWYLLGSKHPKEGEKRDKWRSWMFVKS